MSGLLSKERILAPGDYNRWRVPLASIAIHMCIGSVKVDPMEFETKFGAPISQLELLVSQNSVTISKLMEIAPIGTVDPTSGLYNSTMILMAVLLGVALISNAFMRPVDPKHHIRDN